MIMITANIKILCRVQGYQNIHHQGFWYQLANILWPDSVGRQIWGAEQSSLCDHWYLKEMQHSLGKTEWEKDYKEIFQLETSDKEIFKQSPDGWCLTMLSELLHRTTTRIKGMIRPTIKSKKKWIALAECQNPCTNQKSREECSLNRKECCRSCP